MDLLKTFAFICYNSDFAFRIPLSPNSEFNSKHNREMSICVCCNQPTKTNSPLLCISAKNSKAKVISDEY